MSNRCARCRRKIDHKNSSYVVMLFRSGNNLDYAVERSAKVPDGSLVLHVNADRDCGKEVSGFRLNIIKTLGLSTEVDTEFLDYL